MASRRSSLTLKIIRYCAEEVGRQQAEPIAVYWMLRAWAYAMLRQPADSIPTPAILKTLGALVEPVNRNGWRTGNVRVGSRVAPPCGSVPALMVEFCGKMKDFTPDEAYRYFEEIHPFWDGNGRTGKILLNWLANRLDNPLMPPNFWGCLNP